MNNPKIIIFDPFIRSYAHYEGLVCYHANEDPGPSDCVWIMPGTLNLTT